MRRTKLLSEEHFEVVVLGVGGMGSATLYALAKRGVRACGMDQFGVAHDRGSSHGQTRIIRKAYFERPDYMPLLHHAYESWEDLQRECGQELLKICGMIAVGKPGTEVIRGLDLTYGEHEVSHERLSSREAEQRYPQVNFAPEFVTYFDPLAGFLRVERCVKESLRLALKKGAVFYSNEKITGWSARGNSVKVQTTKRTVHAEKLIITAGPWAIHELAGLNLNLEIWRKVAFWYDSPNISDYWLERFPIYYFELDYGAFYGFPVIDPSGLKVAEHILPDVVVDPDRVDRDLQPCDEEPVLRFLDETFSGFKPKRTRYSICMYTKTPDEDFVLDIHPEYPNVILGTGFSGHGFKFAPVIGEILSDLALEGSTQHPIDFLRLGRFLN